MTHYREQSGVVYLPVSVCLSCLTGSMSTYPLLYTQKDIEKQKELSIDMEFFPPTAPY